MATPGLEVLTTPEAAELLHVSLASLRRWCKDGVGPPHWLTPGGQRRFYRDEVLAWLAARQGKARI